MPLILGTNSIKDTGFNVANSLRGDRGSSTYLNKTLGTGNRDKWTWSAWLKKNSNGNNISLFASYPDSSNFSVFKFTDEDTLQYHDKAGGGDQAKLVTNRKFRDNSAWYHIVLVYDSGNGTSGNRIRLYINGSEETSFSTDTMPGQNNDSTINRSGAHYLGTDDTTGLYLDCYLAEVVFTDGQALDPTSFGEFDEDTGIWKPIDVSGLTFGTNGFYLDFENSGSLGADVSGNGNNFTVNNLTSIDQTTDTCTNNFATLNPLETGTNKPTLSEGNLKAVWSASSWGTSFSSIGATSGKWYCEVEFDSAGFTQIGIGELGKAGGLGTQVIGDLGADLLSYTYYSNNGNFVRLEDGSSTNQSVSFGSSYTSGDIIGVYMDLDNGKLYFAKNGTLVSSTGKDITLGGFYGFVFSLYSGTNIMNFGNPITSISSSNTDDNGYGNFEYSPNITGDGSAKSFYALNTKNLAEYG